MRPGALAGATGAAVADGLARPPRAADAICAGRSSGAPAEAGDRPTLAEIADAAAAAFRAARTMAGALAILPAATARMIVDAMLGAVDDARAADGLEVLGYGDRPTAAELRASWAALDPAPAARRGRLS
jgi:hypothetical protein